MSEHYHDVGDLRFRLRAEGAATHGAMALKFYDQL